MLLAAVPARCYARGTSLGKATRQNNASGGYARHTGGTVSSHQRTLLFIENDPDHQMLVRMSLGQHDRYRVLYANDGAEGVAKAREEQPDVILLDVMMPKLDGLAVMERLHADRTTRAIPVIFLSAKALPEDIKAGMDRGACGYLTKPFDALHLEERLDEILDAAGRQLT